MGRPTNSLYMGTQAVAAVRLARLIALAERLGYNQTRGAGAGKLGSASALCAAIADADPEQMYAALAAVIGKHKDA